jgi:hypothetical protein
MKVYVKGAREHATIIGPINECQDCDCRSFHATGEHIAAQKPMRDWVTGKPLAAPPAPPET